MITRLLEKWENKLRRDIRKKINGHLILWVVYKPQQEPPNIIFHLHPDMGHDSYLQSLFSDIANHIRDEYGELFKGDNNGVY